MQYSTEVIVPGAISAVMATDSPNAEAHSADENFTLENLDREEGQFLISKKVLGEGATSVVKLAWSKRLNKKCAVKIVAKYKLNEKSHHRLRRELEILKFLSQSNSSTICNLIEVTESNQHYFIFLEFIEGGDLISYIESHGKVPEPVAIVIMKNVLLSIQFIHNNSVVHRDIKAENFLLEFDENRAITAVKLTDFGLSDWVDPEKSFSTPCGSPNYTGTPCIALLSLLPTHPISPTQARIAIEAVDDARVFVRVARSPHIASTHLPTAIRFLYPP